VLTLALAIGANTAVFSAVHTVLIRPLPYPQPETLVMIWEKREAEGVMDNSVSAADYLDWARQATSFSAMAASTEVTADLTGEGDPEKLPIAAVSSPYFQVFGIPPLHGRTFENGEDAVGRNRLVVLGHAIWRQRFGADAGVVGRRIALNGIPYQVIGVLPQNAVFPHGEAQMFVPLVLQAPPEPPSRVSHQFLVYARLKPGVSFSQARSEMDRIGKDLERQYPDLSRGHGSHVTSLLLVGAGLTLRSFQAVLSQDAGIETNDRLTFRLGLPGARYKDGPAAARFFTELEARLAAEPLIRSVGATMLPPLTGLDGRRGVVVENREVGPDDGPTRAHPRVVTSNYLQAIGSRVREGRGFLPTDTATSPMVAMVNETMARRYWPGASPVGQRVRFTDQDIWREVIGIVGDVKHWGLDAPVNPEMYIPTTQFPTFALTFVLHANGDALALVPIALVLAAAGIYGVMAHLVSLRTPEIGIRLTLGASPWRVMQQVLGEGLAQAAIGLIIGLGASLAVMKGLSTILFGVAPTDPLTLAGVAATLLGVAVAAVAVPALRAMRIDPVSALRAE